MPSNTVCFNAELETNINALLKYLYYNLFACLIYKALFTHLGAHLLGALIVGIIINLSGLVIPVLLFNKTRRYARAGVKAE